MNATIAVHALSVLTGCFLVGTATLAVAWLAALCIRKNAALRHLIWLMAYSALFVMPLLVGIVPAQTLPAGMGKTQRTREQPRDWAPVRLGLLGLWMAGAVVTALQGAVAGYGVRALRSRSAKCAIDSPDPRELAQRIGVKGSWELRRSATANSPAAMTWGFLHPVVLLPQESVFWSGERLEAILLHELAHVRRRDSLCQCLAFAVCTLYWFHPGVWLCARAMRQEAEVAADDAVLLSGVRPSAYAAELLHCAASLANRQPSFGRLAVPIVGNSAIETRIESILDPGDRRRKMTPEQAWKAIGAANMIVFLLVFLRPYTSFADDRQPTRATVPVMSAAPSTGSRKAARDTPAVERAVARQTQPRSIANDGQPAWEPANPADLAEFAKQDAENAAAKTRTDSAPMPAVRDTEPNAAEMRYKSRLDAARALLRRERAN
jgi:beta-lactamase regulating signal transducer with metallopeptidase domain